MEKKRAVPLWVSILLLVLSLVSLGFLLSNFFITGNFGPTLFLKVQRIIYILTIVFSLTYCVFGFNKDNFVFFIVVMFLMMVNEFIAALIAAGYSHILPCAMSMLSYGALVLLTFGTHKGRRKSMILCGVCIGARIVKIISLAILVGTLNVGSEIICNITIGFILWLMNYAKYKEKEYRHATQPPVQ
ncbi:MAG: hypothetical protein Q4B67_03880 [Eubacteriales bacterium]|nr:hypothetical protein [Eubacteriales bacterium]